MELSKLCAQYKVYNICKKYILAYAKKNITDFLVSQLYIYIYISWRP